MTKFRNVSNLEFQAPVIRLKYCWKRYKNACHFFDPLCMQAILTFTIAIYLLHIAVYHIYLAIRWGFPLSRMTSNN